ncbi:MAG TPA: trypsin-like serine protease [Jatrophihabitans sp.]|nr:trypsin-like serine protease [Jatrophihabitans sp.]
MRLSFLALLMAVWLSAGARPAGAAHRSAATGTPIPTVGPLFFPSVVGIGPTLRFPHYCSASVVDSPGADLVLTAAHCVYGTGLGIEFAPGYHDGVSPFGVWAVRRVYLDPAWLHGHDPQLDFAVLQLARHHGVGVEHATGSAPALGRAPASGSSVTVAGYVAGSGGAPIRCTAPVYYTDGYPSFDCAGFADGTSGGPWLAGGRLVGVIGGLYDGGCTPNTSYSAAFGADVAALLTRAEAGGPGDEALLPGADGC